MRTMKNQAALYSHFGTSLVEDEKSPFDNRSSERLSRDEVVVRSVADPNAALLEAILLLHMSDDRKHEAA